jgi:Uri superfamily endonuclease
MKLKKNLSIDVGRLGKLKFPKGYYCYVGSALGESVNLENRVKRHKKLNKEKHGNLHWHIDYFLVNTNVDIVGIDTIVMDQRLECKISEKLGKFSIGSIPKFGSSDCNCKSHFHYFKDELKLKKALKVLDDENSNPSFGN